MKSAVGEGLLTQEALWPLLPNNTPWCAFNQIQEVIHDYAS
jgi:hypothetical protein